MKAVFDACVLYPTVLRQILIGVASAGLITPVWSTRLTEEWARTAARLGGAADDAMARAEIARLNLGFPAAAVETDTQIEARLWLPDPGDLHVLATAIAAGAEVIVTLNLRDFPIRETSPHGVRALHPDAVLTDLWLAHPETVQQIVRDVHHAAEMLSGADMPLRALMKRARLPRLGKVLTREGAG
ncbi:MAG: PIN domain-containing protein [Pseudomonadota bacterium]